MANWLQQLPIKKDFRVLSTESVQAEDRLPSWISFLIWAGWWMNNRSSENERSVLVLLLPTRICCAAFCSLGALIRSIEKNDTILSWNQFMKLPEGTKVCLRYPDPKSSHRRISVKGIICDGSSKTERKIMVLSKNKRFKGVIQSIMQRGYEDYEITASWPLSPQLEIKLSNTILFYKTVVNKFKTASVRSWFRECLIVTSLTSWKKEIENIIVTVSESAENYPNYALSELLMTSKDLNAEYSGAFLSTPKSDILNSIDSPIAILNGPEAIKSWERIKSPNVIMLLEHLEYEETIENFLALLSDARSNRSIVLPESIPENPPSGVEMVFFDF